MAAKLTWGPTLVLATRTLWGPTLVLATRTLWGPTLVLTTRKLVRIHLFVISLRVLMHDSTSLLSTVSLQLVVPL